MSKAPVLSQTALIQLLKNNHKNFVSVKVGEQVFMRVHRPLAMRFSSVWRRALKEPLCREVTVTFPREEEIFPGVGELAPTSSKAKSAGQMPALLSPTEANQLMLKLIGQWMELGGSVPEGPKSAPYPKTHQQLQRLRAVAQSLEIRELVQQVDQDLASSNFPPPPPKKCTQCRRFEHPGEECPKCWYCEELGHNKRNCARYHAELRVRREEWEERQRAFWEREARREKKAAQQERWDERHRQEMIRTGQMAVGDGGKTIVVWSRD